MRWALATAVVALTASAAAAQPVALPDQEWAYQTWYDGFIHQTYLQKNTSIDGRPAPHRHETFYSFRTVEVETFRLRKGQVTSRSTLTVDVKGLSLKRVSEQVGLTNDFVIVDYVCAVESVPKPIKNTTNFGSTATPIPVSQDPLVQVSWFIPIPLANSTPAVKWQVAGSKRCNVQGDYDAGAIGHLDQKQVPHDEVDEAYNGRASIRYFSLKNPLAEWTKEFHVHEKGSTPRIGNAAPKDAVFDLDSEVHFRALNDPDLQKDPINKVGSLILQDGLAVLASVPVPPGKGKSKQSSQRPDVVLVPGMGAGEVKLDVNATIIGKPTPLRRSAAAGAPAKEILIARGAKKLARDAPFLLTITLTPEGKALLAKHKGPLKGRYVLSLKPKGSTKWLTRSKSVTWPELTLP